MGAACLGGCRKAVFLVGAARVVVCPGGCGKVVFLAGAADVAGAAA